MTTYIKNNKFFLNILPDWTDNSVYTIEGPVDDGLKHSILITIDHDIAITDPCAYARINIVSLENELQGYRQLKQEMITLDNELPACEVVCKWNPSENRQVYQKVFYVINKKTGYILTATFSKKTWKMRGEEVDKIMKSFQPGIGMADDD